MKSLFRSVFPLLLCLMILPAMAQKKQKPVIIQSPDKTLSIELNVSDHLSLSVKQNGIEVATVPETALRLAEYPDAFMNPVIRTVTITPYSYTIHPAVAEKRSVIPDTYVDAEVWFKGNYGIRMRAYNDAVAWRLMTRMPGSITIVNEALTLNMNRADSTYFGEEDNFISHSERLYPYISTASIKENQMCVIPVVFREPKAVLVFAEADLLDYPGLYLTGKGAGTNAFSGVLPAVAKDEYVSKDKRSYLVGGREAYIARTAGTREFPWRVFGISKTDAGLLENDIMYRLASPCKLQSTDWIKPGKVAWDWWNNWNIWGVPFRAGINTETYKYYIDFASKFGLEYVILDEGWSAVDDLDKINPDINMDELLAYAAQKNVRLILWVTGRALEEKFESSLAKFEKWGVSGIKVDFLIRDDQRMVNYYEQVAAASAKHHLLVDFHGAFKPSGFSRTYPNALTREGVRGSENNKWSKEITPAHDCTLPFTRMFSGPMDYTPGAMTNAVKDNFVPNWSEPMSMGTRCHELAKYILFESPLQMLCDNPTSYLREPEAMDFLATVPVTWDETHAIDARIGNYLTVAKRHGESWYLGSMTDWSPRDFDVKLDFLPEGSYLLKSWIDGPNADRKGEDFAVRTETVSNKSVIRIHLAPGGGFAATLVKL